MQIVCNGRTVTYTQPTAVEQIAVDVGMPVEQVFCAAVDGEMVDMAYMVQADATVRLYGWDTPEGKTVYNRTCAYVLAQAVKTLFPTVKLACGPADEKGFCYDFDFATQPSRDVLQRIEEEMQRIVQADLPYKRVEMTRTRALRLMAGFDEVYKMELVASLPKGTKVAVYYQGDFANISRGPFLPSTGRLRAFKLLSMSTAYWQNDKNNKKLRRVYGVGFVDTAAMAAYLDNLKSSKGRAKGALVQRVAPKKVAKNS